MDDEGKCFRFLTTSTHIYRGGLVYLVPHFFHVLSLSWRKWFIVNDTDFDRLKAHCSSLYLSIVLCGDISMHYVVWYMWNIRFMVWDVTLMSNIIRVHHKYKLRFFFMNHMPMFLWLLHKIDTREWDWSSITQKCWFGLCNGTWKKLFSYIKNQIKTKIEWKQYQCWTFSL